MSYSASAQMITRPKRALSAKGNKGVPLMRTRVLFVIGALAVVLTLLVLANPATAARRATLADIVGRFPAVVPVMKERANYGGLTDGLRVGDDGTAVVVPLQ